MLPREGRPPTKRRVDYRPPAFCIDTLHLTFDLDPEATEVTAVLAFRRNPDAAPQDRRAPLVLDGEQQSEVRVELDGRVLSSTRAQLSSSHLTVVEPPDQGVLTVRSRIAPLRNIALEGLYLSSGVFCTQCEPEGFRRITYFPDRPDVLTQFMVTLRAERARYPVLLSNGNRVEAGPLNGGWHYATWRDPFPKPSYLFALVAGDLSALTDTFTTASGRTVELAIYSTARNLPRCGHAMESLKRAMRWDEQRFGREYDLDTFMIFCADDFNMGAMENKGLNIFNSRLVLADPEVATDADYNAIEGVVGHEYFHNWTGNRVTCRDWFQLSLKEGLTVFRDQEFSSDVGSRAVERIAAVEYLRREQFSEDAGPMAHPVRPDEYQEINNFYTSTVYEKGAEVIRMQHTLLGAEAFRRGMDLYFDRYDGRAVTCDDFAQAMQDASGLDLSQFRRWYGQAGTPVVAARGRYDPRARTYTLELAQRTAPTPGQPRKLPFHIPVRMGLVGPDGRDIPLRLQGEAAAGPATRVLSLTQASQAFRFLDVPARPVPSLLRGFSAPVKLEFDYSDDDLALLAASDSDAVNRWDAAQRSFAHAILRLARAARAGSAPASPATGRARARESAAAAVPDNIVALVERLLTDTSSDPALIALALTLPDPAYVAALEPTLDVDGVTGAWYLMQRELARRHRALLERVESGRRPAATYAPTPAQVGERSLANMCLRYLGSLDDAPVRARAIQRYDRAGNMTDAVAALAAIKDSAAADRDDLFARFEARWRDEPLVLDKWFALQARSHRDDALPRVRALLAHPRFNVKNPNRVRSLVGAFALGNFTRFHSIDGSGYAFTADQILALDPANPQLASALAGAFNLWKRFPEPRRAAMERALVRVARTPGLSPDVREVVTRTLED